MLDEGVSGTKEELAKREGADRVYMSRRCGWTARQFVAVERAARAASLAAMGAQDPRLIIRVLAFQPELDRSRREICQSFD
jgi:hypothetical protein